MNNVVSAMMRLSDDGHTMYSTILPRVLAQCRVTHVFLINKCLWGSLNIFTLFCSQQFTASNSLIVFLMLSIHIVTCRCPSQQTIVSGCRLYMIIVDRYGLGFTVDPCGTQFHQHIKKLPLILTKLWEVHISCFVLYVECVQLF